MVRVQYTVHNSIRTVVMVQNIHPGFFCLMNYRVKRIGVLKRITGTWGAYAGRRLRGGRAYAASAPGGGPLLRRDLTIDLVLL